MQSDEGGDIVPLVSLFVRVLQRGLKELEDPDFAEKLFQEDLRARSQSMFQQWGSCLDDFLTQVRANLALTRLRTEQVGDASPGDLERLRNRWRGNDVWLLRVHQVAKRQDVLLRLAPMTAYLAARVERDQAFPSLLISIRNPVPLAARQYLPVGELDLPNDEFIVVANEPWVIVRNHQRVARVPFEEAAAMLADRLRRVAEQLVSA